MLSLYGRAQQRLDLFRLLLVYAQDVDDPSLTFVFKDVVFSNELEDGTGSLFLGDSAIT